MVSTSQVGRKLRLGLGLVFVSGVLLLGGTLRAVWTGYQLSNAVRAKLDELTAVEKVSALVGTFVAPGTVVLLVRDPERLQVGAREIEAAIREYEVTARESLTSRGGAGSVLQAPFVEALREQRDHIVSSVSARNVRRFGGRADPQIDADNIDALHAVMRSFESAARDLHESVRGSLADKLNESRRHYRTALMILVPGSVVGLLVMYGLLRAFSAWLLYPVRGLEADASAVTTSSLQQRILRHPQGDLGSVATASNIVYGPASALFGGPPPGR